MSRSANNRAAGDGRVGDRDRFFAEMILGRAHEDGWAMAIVGRSHAADVNGSMRRLLHGRGVGSVLICLLQCIECGMNRAPYPFRNRLVAGLRSRFHCFQIVVAKAYRYNPALRLTLG